MRSVNENIVCKGEALLLARHSEGATLSILKITD